MRAMMAVSVSEGGVTRAGKRMRRRGSTSCDDIVLVVMCSAFLSGEIGTHEAKGKVGEVLCNGRSVTIHMITCELGLGPLPD